MLLIVVFSKLKRITDCDAYIQEMARKMAHIALHNNAYALNDNAFLMARKH